MKVLFIPIREHLNHPLNGIFSDSYYYSTSYYYVPLSDIFPDVSDHLMKLNVIDILLNTQSREDLYKKFCFVSDDFFAQYNKTYFHYDRPSGYGYIVNRETNIIRRLNLGEVEDFKFSNTNLLFTTKNANQHYIDHKQIMPNGKILLLETKPQTYEILLFRRLAWEGMLLRYGIIGRTHIWGQVVKVIKYKNSVVLSGSISLNLPNRKEELILDMYVTLPPDWKINNINSFDSLWKNHIYAQNKWKIIQWVRRLASWRLRKCPPLGFFEYKI